MNDGFEYFLLHYILIRLSLDRKAKNGLSSTKRKWL